MVGSNAFRRTIFFGGTEEKEAEKDFVHIAITYQPDGTITGYRNGRPCPPSLFLRCHCEEGRSPDVAIQR
jgi:hypothetical protein